MSKVKFYQYKKCSTCVKASKFLASKKIDFKDLAIVDTPPTKTELKKMLAAYEGNIKKLFNTSGVMYRELKIKAKINDMSEKDAIDLLSKNGKLIKRPFLIAPNGTLVGFKEDEWSKLF
ncbi:MAG: arsenate reductase family protein [Bdellovibrionales bacterium]